MLRCSTSRWFLLPGLLLAALAGLSGCKYLGSHEKTVRYIAYVGLFTNPKTPEKGPNNPFDLLHQQALEHELEELNRHLLHTRLELKIYDCRRDGRVADSLYRELARDSSVVAVLDNTWGAHIGPAAGTIRQAALPVLSMNADKNGNDFGPAAVFTGNSDNVPFDLTAYLTEALHAHQIAFLSETDYTLQPVYLQAFKKAGVNVAHQFTVKKDDYNTADTLRLMRELDTYFGQNPGAKNDVLVLAIHSDWGNKVLAHLERAHTDLHVLGHAFVTKEDHIRGFGKRSGNQLILVTEPQDALNRRLALDLEHFRLRNGELFSAVNAPLYLRRCQDAVSILKPAVVAVDSSRAPDRQDFRRFFSSLGDSSLAGEFDLYDFDSARTRISDETFTRFAEGETHAMPLQMNHRRELIPNLIFGMEIQDIYDLDVATNSFTSDFYYWVKVDTANRGAEDLISFQNMKQSESTQELLMQKVVHGILYKLYRVSGKFYVNYQLEDFPFDQQELAILVEILNPSDRLKISFDQSSLVSDPHIIERFKVTGWNKNRYYVTVDNHITASKKGDPDSDTGRLGKFKSFAFRLIVKRIALGAFLQIILPLILIGLVALSLLFIRDLSFENVGEVSVGTFLGIIAFSISLSGLVPASESLTKADLLFWLTFVVVFFTFMTTILLNSVFAKEDIRTNDIRKLRWAAAILYPAAVLYVVLS